MKLYNYQQKIKSAETKIIEANYSQKNKDLIFEFINVLYAEGWYPHMSLLQIPVPIRNLLRLKIKTYRQ